MWNDFLQVLQIHYPSSNDSIHSGCNLDELAVVETSLHLSIPPELQAVYLANNGQRTNTAGIFKAVSGYNKYSRLSFLPLSSVISAWNQLCDDKVDVFRPSDIPFAASYIDVGKFDDIYCVDTLTGAVFLLWVACFDPFLPWDWQTARFFRAETLNDFLRSQSQMYG